MLHTPGQPEIVPGVFSDFSGQKQSFMPKDILKGSVESRSIYLDIRSQVGAETSGDWTGRCQALLYISLYGSVQQVFLEQTKGHKIGPWLLSRWGLEASLP
jgi:hypothetical protein